MSYLEIFLMALVPGIGMAVSALVALWKRPSPTLTSIFQYFTAGVILAATVAELVPDLDIANYLWSVAIGFSIGVALMLLMRELFEAHEPQGLILDPSSAAVGSQGSGVARSGTTFGFLAFGVAALLYLVVEELLLEAHHIRHRTSLVAATFFLGFLIILLAEGAGY